MINWWNAMSVFEQVLASLGIVSLLMLFLQIMIMLFGALYEGGGGVDADAADLPDADSFGGDASSHGADLSSDFGGDAGGGFDGDISFDGSSHVGAGHTSHYSVHAGDSDIASHAQTGLRLFTVQGIISFLAIFSWSGLLMIKSGLHMAVSLMIAAALGFIAMFIMASLMRFMLKLQYDGTMDIRSALGKVGTVYLTIPAERSYQGKVSIIVEDRLMELDAITDEEVNIPTGAQVFVSGVSGRNTLLVKRK